LQDVSDLARHKGTNDDDRRAGSMYARLIAVTTAPDQAEAARSALHGQVVPMVKAVPGFIAGYWLDDADGMGYAFVLFDTLEHARETAPPQGASPPPGVTVQHVEFREVIASA
jgi:hypothetical protein